MTATTIIITITIAGLLLLGISVIVLGSGCAKTVEKEPPPKLTLKDYIMKIGTTEIKNTGEFYTVFVYKQRCDCCSDIYYSKGERGCFFYKKCESFFDEDEAKEYAREVAVQVRNTFMERLRTGQIDFPHLSADDLKQWNKTTEQIIAGMPNESD